MNTLILFCGLFIHFIEIIAQPNTGPFLSYMTRAYTSANNADEIA
jgi:hypothetical protein